MWKCLIRSPDIQNASGVLHQAYYILTAAAATYIKATKYFLHKEVQNG